MFKYVSKPCQFKICIFFQLRGLPNHFTGDSLNNLRRPNTPNQLCWILILTHLRIFPLLLLHFNRILINWCGIQEKWQLWPFPSWWQGFGRYLWTVKWNAVYGPPLLAMDSSHRSVKSSGWGGGVPEALVGRSESLSFLALGSALWLFMRQTAVTITADSNSSPVQTLPKSSTEHKIGAQ